MKTLTLTQPWSQLVALQKKRIETRSWPTSYRGRLAIHAAKGFPKWARETVHNDWDFFNALQPELAEHYQSNGVKLVPCQAGRQTSAELPLGAVVATCNLVACWPTSVFCVDGLVTKVDHDSNGSSRIVTAKMTPQERAFGDYAPGRFAWILEDVQMLPKPVPAKGALSLWEWEAVNA